jgi:hypothetical protein
VPRNVGCPWHILESSTTNRPKLFLIGVLLSPVFYHRWLTTCQEFP